MPFWSPDSRSVAYFADGELRQVSIADGTTLKICAVTKGAFLAGAWSANGTILLTSLNTPLLQSVPAAGGRPTPLTGMGPSQSYRNLQFLPDGEQFLYSVVGEPESAGTYVASLSEPGKRRKIATADRGILRHVAGHLLWFEDGTLFAQRADDPGAPKGPPARVAAPVARGLLEAGLFRASARTLAYVSGVGGVARSQLAWVDRSGNTLATLGAPGQHGQLALAPDGSRVAVDVFDGNRDLWVMDVARGVLTRVTSTSENEVDPVWSPDGKSLAWCVYSATGGVRLSLRRKALVEGSAEDVVGAVGACPESWLTDGALLGTTVSGSSWSRTADGRGTLPGLPEGRTDEFQVSPDGRWLAFVSWESGRAEVYLQPFARDGERVRVSAEGGGAPKWRGDGRELFFVVPPDRLMAVDVHSLADRVRLGTAVQLFARQGLFSQANFDDYAPSADGQRFLVKLPVADAEKPQLHVIANWTSRLLAKEDGPR
jgi:Tol biopolymer transport system component